MRAVTSLGVVLSLCAFAAFASDGPTPLPYPAAIEAPRDTPYPGTIKVTVDATDITRHIFRVTEKIPVRGGNMTLLYPQWLPGHHSPVGRVDAMAGLKIQANGQAVEWTRDPVNVYAFHVPVPANATTLDVSFQFLSGGDAGESRRVMTPEMLNLQWVSNVIYPAGYYVRQIPVEASVILPTGWEFATALETASSNGATTTFKTTPLETLMDSPMFAGKNVKKVDLGNIGGAPVRLNVFADRPEQLEAKPEHIEAHKNLVTQFERLFASHHFDHYDILLAVTDRLGGIGLEHHRSSENGVGVGYFTEWDKTAGFRDLLPHEMTHSWNGKFRRPADLWTPNYNVAMRNSLLWVYEGQTQYWGYVLAARSGLLSKQQAIDVFAMTAATYDNQAGREWKTLADTTNDPITSMRRAQPWRSWQRSEDYYSEGMLVWLDADTLIRQMSGGKKSLDDFAKAFFGIRDGSYVPATYEFKDVVNTLNAVQPYDWAKFLRTRLDTHLNAPLDGIKRGGYSLVYKDTPSAFDKDAQAQRKSTDLAYSLGMSIGREGRIGGVRWNGPAHNAGLTPGTQLIAVNGTAYDGDKLKDAIKAGQKSNAPLELLVKNGENYTTVKLDYRDGLKYPQLERDEKVPALLDQILESKK